MSDCQHNPGRELETGDVQIQGHQLGERSDEETLYKLVDCLYGGDGEVDIETIDRYLEELDQAEAEPDEFDVEKGLQQFHQRFDTAFEYRLEEVKTTRKRRPLARIAIIAAAMCIFVATAQASGWDIIGAIARWTSEQFSYVSPIDQRKEPEQEMQFSSLQDALDKYGVKDSLAPNAYPEGTVLLDVRVSEEKEQTLFSASYNLHGEKIFISIRQATGMSYSKVEIDNPNVEIYVAGGIEHYLVADVKQQKASWCSGNWECYVAGDLSRDDIVLMIDSIYK